MGDQFSGGFARGRALLTKTTAAGIGFTMIVAGLVTVGEPAQAAPNPASQALGSALEELGTVIAVGSSIEELSQALPLTGLAPAAADGLDLLQSLNTALTNVKSDIDELDPASPALETALENADETLPSGVVFEVGDVALANNSGVVDYTIPLTLTRAVSVPVAFESDVFDMSGSTIAIDLGVSTTLNVRFDTSQYSNPDAAFSLTTAPTIAVTATAAAGSPISASTRIGVTDATATLSGLSLNATFSAPIHDPDNVGGITRDEWMNTQVSDLVGDVIPGGSVVGDLSFDTSLISGTPDAGPFSIGDDNLFNGYSFTLPNLGDLADFGLISPAAIIAGIGQAAAGLGGAQSVGDVDLPFIGGSVRRIAQASRPILDVVDALGVVCGTEGGETGVPAGSVEDLVTGTQVFCRAIVTTGVEPGSVTWTAEDATADNNATGGDADGTVGLTQSKNAVFTTTADGDFVVSVAYTAEFDDDNDNSPDRTEARTSTQAPLSVQGLATAFKALAPFQAPAASLFQYNSTTHALTADLSMTIDPAPVTLPINVGSQLESETGVAGLQTTGGNVVADAGPISLDLKAGVFLLPEEDWDTVARAGGGCPDPSIVDPALCDDALNLFFVEVDPTGGEFSVADASFALSTTPEPSLSGQLGYLEVTASVPQFELGRADATAPVIRVDLTPQPGSMTVGGIAVPNAIPLRELLFDITGRTSVSPLNLKFEGDFDISASLNGANIGTAGVGVVWNPVLVGSPTITPDVNFDDLFANFNPVPNLFGTATNGTASTTVLETTGTTFTASAVGARLFNITDETSCEVSAFTATSLTCAEPLAGSADSQWDSGDLYRVEVGSPLAMLEILLDNLDQIVEAIDNVSGAGLGEALDTELPIVGVSPRSLLTQIQDIRRTIDEIRQPAANVVCGTAHDGGAITGDPSEIGSTNRTIFCNAVHNKPASEVVWTVDGATVLPPADPSTTVGAAPSDVVTITFSGTDTLVEGDGYRVNLSFSDNDGPHDAEYPSLSQPGSIQQLERVIKEKLGIDPTDPGFGLSLADVGSDKVVVLDLAVQRCNTATLCAPKRSTATPT